jgi:transcriptional regulator with XRE-family HTH domain
VNTFKALWQKLKASKKYREAFVAAEVKQAIPFQIRALMKAQGVSQRELAERSGLTQGAISRAANPKYGNLSLNTLIRIAAGFDVAFVGRFVPFSELTRWLDRLNEDSTHILRFEEDSKLVDELEAGNSMTQQTGAAHAALTNEQPSGAIAPLFRLTAPAVNRSPGKLLDFDRAQPRLGSAVALQTAVSQ